jgi:hypothetical protein
MKEMKLKREKIKKCYYFFSDQLKLTYSLQVLGLYGEIIVS